MNLFTGTILTTLSALLLAGCATSSSLTQQQNIARPDYGDEAITAAAANSGIGMSESGSAAPGVGGLTGSPAIPGAGAAAAAITGTWTFTTPPTVTRNKKSSGQFDQYSLYWSQPQPADTPFLTITTAPDVKSLVEASPDQYQIRQSRVYLLNGQPTREYNGYTKDGARFCEILIFRGSGVQLEAIAIVKGDDQAKTALDILGSITWTPNGPATH
jgi:hypothetical protein